MPNVTECAEIDNEGKVSWKVIGKSPPNTRSRKKQMNEIYHTKHVEQIRKTIEIARSPPKENENHQEAMYSLGKTRASNGNNLKRRSKAHTREPSSSTASTRSTKRDKDETSAVSDDKTNQPNMGQKRLARSPIGRRRGT